MAEITGLVIRRNPLDSAEDFDKTMYQVMLTWMNEQYGVQRWSDTWMFMKYGIDYWARLPSDNDYVEFKLRWGDDWKVVLIDVDQPLVPRSDFEDEDE